MGWINVGILKKHSRLPLEHDNISDVDWLLEKAQVILVVFIGEIYGGLLGLSECTFLRTWRIYRIYNIIYIWILVACVPFISNSVSLLFAFRKTCMVSKDWEHLPPRWVTFHRKRVSLLFLDLDYVCYGRKMDCFIAGHGNNDFHFHFWIYIPRKMSGFLWGWPCTSSPYQVWSGHIDGNHIFIIIIAFISMYIII